MSSPQLKSISVAATKAAGSLTVRIPGRVVWNEDRTVRLFPAFAGRVLNIDAKAGDVVKAGRVLARLASPDFAAAQADARTAATNVGLEEKIVAREKLLFENDVAPARELQAAEADLSRARTELERASSRLKVYGGTDRVDATYALKAPISGTVVERNINPGEELRPDMNAAGTAPMFVITDPSRLWLLLDATEQDLRRLHVGDAISFSSNAWPGETFQAKIEMVSEFVDPQTRSIKVRGSIDNAARKLKGEMFVNAELQAPAREGVAVPGKAVFLQGDKHYVFIEEAPGRFMPLQVATGPDSGDSVVVTEGLSSGQRVVVAGSLFLQQILQTKR
ncbi:MAG: efflux RND transporter periplasmic adaptor subunit [Betaproteobacteria bacterium]